MAHIELNQVNTGRKQFSLEARASLCFGGSSLSARPHLGSLEGQNLGVPVLMFPEKPKGEGKSHPECEHHTRELGS